MMSKMIMNIYMYTHVFSQLRLRHVSHMGLDYRRRTAPHKYAQGLVKMEHVLCYIVKSTD